MFAKFLVLCLGLARGIRESSQRGFELPRNCDSMPIWSSDKRKCCSCSTRRYPDSSDQVSMVQSFEYSDFACQLHKDTWERRICCPLWAIDCKPEDPQFQAGLSRDCRAPKEECQSYECRDIFQALAQITSKFVEVNGSIGVEPIWSETYISRESNQGYFCDCGCGELVDREAKICKARNENATYCGATRPCCTRIWDCEESDPWPEAVTKQQRAVWWGEADLQNERDRLRPLLRQLEKLGSQCVESCQSQRRNLCFQNLMEVAEKKILGKDITVHQKREEKKLKALVEYNNQNRGWYFDSSSKWLAKYQKNLDKSKQPEQRQWNQNALAQQLVVMAPLALHSSEQAKTIEQKTMVCCACKKEFGSFDTVLDSQPFVISFCTAEIPASSVTCRSLARSCERTGHWRQALSMAQRDHHVSLESYKALIAACQASAATTAGAALMRQMHGGVTETGFTWLWTLAKLQLQEADLRARAVVAAIRALEGTVSPAEIAMVSWSLATLGVASPRYRAACSRQASSLRSFTTEELGHLAFGLAAAPGDAKVFLQLQREVRGRLKMVRWTHVAAPLRRKALEDDLLNVLWSCSFAGAVDPPLRRTLGRCFRALGASLDRRFRNSPAPLHSSQALTGPSVRLELCDRLVLFKPVGWEVCDGNVRRQLRHFVGWKGSWPILRSAQHDYGFLHRVDVPCSGLILFAKSFRAYYDLQVQLRAGVMFLGLSGVSPSRQRSFEGVAFASRPAGPAVLFPQKKLQKLRLFRKRKGVVRWAWEFYSAVSDACASLAAGEHGHQQLRGLAEVRSVRQHRRTAFLDVGNAAATRKEGNPVSTSEIDQELLQVVVPLEAEVGNKQLLRPGVLLSFCGVAGRTRRGQASLFAKSFRAEGLTAASPALLATLLSFALVGAVRRKDLCRWLQMSEVELENVLLWDEPRRQRFCSRRARFLRLGRDHRARNRRRSMTAKERHALEEFRGWAEMLRRHAMPLPPDVSDAAQAALGPADPLANLGGAHPHLETFSKRKKRPQVSVMTRLVSELGQLRSDGVDIVDVGGGRGDLAMAVAAGVPRAKVSVIESFAPSAQQGQHRADELKLDVDFHISNAESLASALQAQERRPIIMALHACGGLTDVALEACATLRLPFCICPCCYASQPQLRSRALAPQEEILQRLAESNGLPRDVSQLAAFGINGMRLRHLDPIPVPILMTPELPPSWSVRVYTFPHEWSSRNMILWGHPQEWKQSTGFTSLEIRRDYCVLCHGWFSQSQRRVSALVTWRGDGPTRSGGVGKPARTEFKALAHILLAFGTATLTVVRIATGRRHQIRSHCSFMGHAVVRDEKYTALQTQELDFNFCDSIFLHRHSLFFRDLGNGEHEVVDHLPADLISALARAAGKSPTSTAALNRVINGDLKTWELSEPIPRRMQSEEGSRERGADTLPPKEPLCRQTSREAAQVARSLAQHRKLQQALNLLDSLQSAPVPAADAITFNIAINSCSKVNHWALAEEFYSVMRASSVRPTTVTLNSVVSAHERSGNWQAALGRLMSFQTLGVSADAISFNTAITACARAKQWSFGLSTLRSNEDFMEDNIGYNAAASALEKAKLWRNVLDLVQSMHVGRAEADHFTFSTTLSSLSGAELWQSVFGCLQDMQVLTDNFVLSTLALRRAIIKACEASAQWRLAMHYLFDLEDRQLQPDVALLNSVISAAAKAGEWEQAFSLISSLQRARLEPDVITWGAAATACERAAQWRIAIALLKSMRHSREQPNACVCNAALSSCEKSGQWEQALLMLDVMNASDILPDQIAYNATISACSRTHWQMSLHFLHVMDIRSVRCGTISYNACITACERGGRWQEALACLHAMSPRSILINTVSYNAAIAASARQFRWKEALHLLWDMELLRLCPDVVTYNAAIAALGDSRSWKTLCALLHDMRQHVIQPDLVTFNTSLSVCFHWQTTLLLWHLMVQDQVRPDLLTYNSLLTSFRHHQSWQTALSLLAEMKLAVCRPTTITFEALIACGIHRQHLPMYIEAAQGQILYELHVMAKL
eukprot:s540_g9.t8